MPRRSRGRPPTSSPRSCEAAGERFAVALSGGSTPQAAHRLLASPEYRTRIDWSRWDVFYGDERRVPLDDPRSNHWAATEALLDHVPIDQSRVHPLTDADTYEGLLRAYFGDRPALRPADAGHG